MPIISAKNRETDSHKMESQDRELLLSSENDDNPECNKIESVCKTQDGGEGIKLRTITVEPVLILYILAFVPSRMIIEQFLYTLISEEHNVTSIVRLEQNETHCTVNKSDPHFMEHQVIQNEASLWTMYLKFTQCVPAIFVVLASGTISDRVSRKLPIIVPQIANVAQMSLCVLMVLLKLPKEFLFLAYFVDGISGSAVNLLMGCFAYTGNATSQTNRTLRIAINELCIGIAIAVADIGVGYMIKRTGFLLPFIFVIGIQFLSILYTLFGLQETLTNVYSKARFSCRHMLEPFTIYLRKRPDNKRWKLCLIQCIFWFYAFAAIGRYATATLYLQNVPFCWNAKLLGYYAAVSALVYSFGNIIPVAALKHKNSDMPLLIASCVSAFASMILLGISVTTFMLYSVIFVAMFHQLGYTILRSLISKQVTPQEQGAVFASVAFIEATSDMVGVMTFNSIYAATLLIYRGFVFFIVAAVFGIGTIFAIVLYWKSRGEVSCPYSLVDQADAFVKEDNASPVGINSFTIDDSGMGGSPTVTRDRKQANGHTPT